ncbi:MAG TPA: M4 family metallopeptidase [Actinopolymorphaceae bacterium]
MRSSRKAPLAAAAALAVAVSGMLMLGAGPVTSKTVAPVGGANSITATAGSDGRVSLIQASSEAGIKPVGRASTVEGVAKAHVDAYAGKLGIDADTITYDRTAPTAAGNTVRFAQKIAGVPVLGGGVAVSQTTTGAMQSINSRTTPLAAASFPVLTPRAADANRALAKKTVALREHKRAIPGLKVSAATRDWYDPAVVGRPGAEHALYPVASYVVSGPDVSYQVLVNLKTRAVQLAWSTHEEALNRAVCDLKRKPVDTNNTAAYKCNGKTAAFARTEGQKASTVTDVNKVYDYFHDTALAYARYSNLDLTAFIGTDYHDGKGKALRGTVRVCSLDIDGGTVDCPFRNAFWDGQQMAFGEGVVEDDITAHELTHGVTQKTSGLLYLWQSGAINESMSDVFGEFTDLTNGSKDDTAANSWLIGEGSSLGVIRSLKNPTAYGQPDKMSSPDYTADEGFFDNGGVHTNSGVGNKAAYLIAHGGTFNGVTVKGIGIAKSWKIYWSTENMLLGGADYKDLFTTLPAACKNLVGKPGTYITAADCSQVTKAATATRMYANPHQGAAANVDYCPKSLPTRKTLHQEGFEKTSKWVASPGGSTSNPNGNNRSWFQSQSTLMRQTGWAGSVVGQGSYMYYPLVEGESSGRLTQNNTWSIPKSTRGSVYIRFDHQFVFNALGETGGELLYSTDGGKKWLSATDKLPDNNGQNGKPTLLKGRGGFSGLSQGFGASRYNVTSLKGKSIKLRFNVKSADGLDIWWVDNARLYSCV